MAQMYGENWLWVILASLVITWGIGLTPPLLIRFAFVRRPLSKAWAIGLCAAFWVVNFAIFIALGSQSKTHFVLFLIAFVSYAILRKGAGKQIAGKKPGAGGQGGEGA